MEYRLQCVLQGKAFKHLPHSVRAELILGLLGRDDEQLFETEEQNVTVPKERDGIKAPLIGGNPCGAAAAGTILSRPRTVAPHLLHEEDFRA
jgi:hypothetical protein